MVRFVVTLSEAQKAGLETLRQQRSLRSEAHVIRELIDHALSSGLPTPERQAEIKAHVMQRQREMGYEGDEPPKRPEVPYGSRLDKTAIGKKR